MQVKVTWQGKRRFSAIGESGWDVAIDAKPEVGGEGQGVRPMELLLMGLGGCTGIDLAMILEKMRISVERLEMAVTGERSPTDPQKYTQLMITYEVDAAAAPVNQVLRAVQLSQEKYCSVAHSLSAPLTAVLILNGVRYDAK